MPVAWRKAQRLRQRKQRCRLVQCLGQAHAGENAAGALAVSHPGPGFVIKVLGTQGHQRHGRHVFKVASDRKTKVLPPQRAPRNLRPGMQLPCRQHACQQRAAVVQQLLGRAVESAPVLLAAQPVLEP